MVDGKIFSIIDLGSSKIRLGVFSDSILNNKFISEKVILNNGLNENKEKVFDSYLKEIIINSEKEINKHLKEIDVMIDSPESFSVDLSIKKKIDNIYINQEFIKSFIQEAKALVEKNYNEFKIIHLLINNYYIGRDKSETVPKNIKLSEFGIEIKMLLLQKKTIDYIRQIFKKNHISVKNTYNSSYLKTLNYCNFFKSFDVKVFIDIGLNKTSLSIYKYRKLIFFNYLKIGGSNITKDISKVLELDLQKSEEIKKSFNQTNTSLNNHESKDIIIKVIHARVEEIIDLSFKSLTNLKLLEGKKSILIFTGEGSKILSKNSIYLKEEYNIFDEMNFFEENGELICNSGYSYFSSNNNYEVLLTSKKPKKKGFFEKLFYTLSK